MVNAQVARRRRRLLELSQAEVAERVGVARRTVVMWEQGAMEPSVERLVAWARALGLEPAELLAAPEVEPAEVAGS